MRPEILLQSLHIFWSYLLQSTDIRIVLKVRYFDLHGHWIVHERFNVIVIRHLLFVGYKSQSAQDVVGEARRLKAFKGDVCVLNRVVKQSNNLGFVA